ncbi:protein fuzzy homolog isoform X2 [Agrilus planipennis]|nr:protein fuzzy homolog isoform X2 [Agrilus planipennis]
MSAHVICIASGSGIPIFSRKKGNLENFPFSVIGSLNGVHMFTKSLSITLLNTLMDDYCVVWKEYFESILIIGISSGCTKDALEKLLLSVFNAIMLILGVNEVRSLKNVEKIKRELRVIYPVIDRLLDCLDCGDSHSKYCSDLISLAEVILCNENHQIKIMLDTYTENISSAYTCILIHGKIAVATEEWWDLHPEELKLLAFLASSDSKSNIKDVPVFLPYKSPKTRYRLITCSPMPYMHICCLANQQHSLNEIERSAINCFNTNLEVLNSAIQCFPRNIPESLQLDLGVLG